MRKLVQVPSSALKKENLRFLPEVFLFPIFFMLQTFSRILSAYLFVSSHTINIMNRLKHYSIAGAIFVLIAGTLSHFVYEWSGQNFILGFFFPIDESTWEHMKLIFFPMLSYSLFMNRQLKDDHPCVTSSLLFGTLFGTFLIPVIFYTYSGILGKTNPAFDIATFVLSVLLAFLVVYRLTLSCRMKPYTLWLCLSVWIAAFCFLIFTYSPPNIGIFISPPSSASSANACLIKNWQDSLPIW